MDGPVTLDSTARLVEWMQDEYLSEVLLRGDQAETPG